MQKDNSIPFWRVIFTILIALFHFLRLYDKNTGWYISVEFFFVTSGFLLLYVQERNAQKRQGSQDSPWTYTKRRLARLYPMYLFCFILNFIIYSRILYPSLGSKFKILIECFYEVLGIHMIGLNQPIIFNNVAWYVSALLITGYFIYYMLLHHKKFYIQFVCPLSVILIYSFYYREYTGLEMWGNTKGFLQHDALLRALAGMNMGILAYQLCNKIKSIPFTKPMEYVLDIAEIMGFSFIILYTAIFHNTDDDYILVILMSVCIALAFGHRHCNFIFHNKIVNYFSGLTYAIYLNHGILLSVFKRLDLEFGVLPFVLFFLAVYVMAVISTLILKGCSWLYQNKLRPLIVKGNEI